MAAKPKGLGAVVVVLAVLGVAGLAFWYFRVRKGPGVQNLPEPPQSVQKATNITAAGSPLLATYTGKALDLGLAYLASQKSSTGTAPTQFQLPKFPSLSLKW